jgi:dynein heavy chain, axonemal
LAEIKAYAKPPEGVGEVMEAIMIILGKDPNWPSVKKELADSEFLKRLKEVDKDHISQKTLLRIEKYLQMPKMQQSKIDSISSAAGSMWKWVRAMDAYARAIKDIEPKRIKVANLKEKLKKSEDELIANQQKLQKLK